MKPELRPNPEPKPGDGDANPGEGLFGVMLRCIGWAE
jgi:hypothetical protein